MKRVALSVIAVASAFIVLLDFFIDHPVVNRGGAVLTEGALVLAAFAMILGMFNLFSVHAERIRKRESNWAYSAVLVLSLLIVLLFGFRGVESAPVRWIFRYVYSPLQATIFSLLAFFVLSAAYRAFRIRNWETALFVIAAVIVLLGQVPIGRLMWEGLPALKDWILAVPATAGTRGIILGVALGTIIAGLRILLLMDRPYLE
jgi:hypothetical protein